MIFRAHTNDGEKMKAAERSFKQSPENQQNRKM